MRLSGVVCVSVCGNRGAWAGVCVSSILLLEYRILHGFAEEMTT
jgi:hypothetical protein